MKSDSSEASLAPMSFRAYTLKRYSELVVREVTVRVVSLTIVVSSNLVHLVRMCVFSQ